MAAQQQDALKKSSLFQVQTEKEILESHGVQILECVTSSSSIKNFDIPIGICKIIVDFAMIIADHEARRQRLIAELLGTEENYIGILDRYNKYYIEELKGKTQILSKTQYDLVCPKVVWDSLRDLHSLFYRQVHGECMQYTHSISGICRVFEDCMLPCTHIYDSYILHYVSQRDSRARSSRRDQWKRFSEYDAEMASSTNKYPSASYLVAPLSRLHRYQLILREMSKYTADESTQKIHLNQVMQRLEGQLQKIRKFRLP